MVRLNFLSIPKEALFSYEGHPRLDVGCDLKTFCTCGISRGVVIKVSGAFTFADVERSGVNHIEGVSALRVNDPWQFMSCMNCQQGNQKFKGHLVV